MSQHFLATMYRGNIGVLTWRWLVAAAAFVTSVKAQVQRGTEYAQMLLRNLGPTDAVFFDVDSTLVPFEGIDLLGKYFNVEQQIRSLTQKAMGGAMDFGTSLEMRLNLLGSNGMTKVALDKCVDSLHTTELVPGALAFVAELQNRGVHVFLVSGGFRQMVDPVAEMLAISKDNVYANTILFDENGSCIGFDSASLTSRSRGKPLILEALKKKQGLATLLMVGDGATDLDTRTAGAANAFVGFGGVVVRDKVRKQADWFVYSFREMLDVLVLPSQSEVKSIEAFRQHHEI